MTDSTFDRRGRIKRADGTAIEAGEAVLIRTARGEYTGRLLGLTGSGLAYVTYKLGSKLRREVVFPVDVHPLRQGTLFDA